MNSTVDFYFNKPGKWQDAIKKLRCIALDCGLEEELKWGVPCYTFQKKNIVLIHVFKSYCALLFFKGALLKNTNGILIQQTENVQSARQVRFTGLAEASEQEPVLHALICEAIEVEKAGLTVAMKTAASLELPAEFQNKSDHSPALKKAFAALTPGRQRAYNLYFSAPRKTMTREARVEKCVPKILAGKGLTD